jgi:hypothetical protein
MLCTLLLNHFRRVHFATVSWSMSNVRPICAKLAHQALIDPAKLARHLPQRGVNRPVYGKPTGGRLTCCVVEWDHRPRPPGKAGAGSGAKDF